MPRNYVKKDNPERSCIVCGTIFKPLRDDQLFCSNQRTPGARGGSASCLSLMVSAQRSVTIDHIRAVVAQDYRCWRCEQPLAHIGLAVFLDPRHWDSIDNVVAGCKDCRRAYYEEIATIPAKVA